MGANSIAACGETSKYVDVIGGYATTIREDVGVKNPEIGVA
jgi:hypothetical protein